MVSCMFDNTKRITMSNMDELLSLEDYECSQLFITQEPKENITDLLNRSDDKVEEKDELFLGIAANDFQSPCLSLIKTNNDAMYSDISDVEM